MMLYHSTKVIQTSNKENFFPIPYILKTQFQMNILTDQQFRVQSFQ